MKHYIIVNLPEKIKNLLKISIVKMQLTFQKKNLRLPLHLYLKKRCGTYLFKT